MDFMEEQLGEPLVFGYAKRRLAALICEMLAMAAASPDWQVRCTVTRKHPKACLWQALSVSPTTLPVCRQLMCALLKDAGVQGCLDACRRRTCKAGTWDDIVHACRTRWKCPPRCRHAPLS